MRTSLRVCGLLSWLTCHVATAADVAPDQGSTFRNFVKVQAAALRADDAVPQSADEWQQRKTKLRASLLKAWGGFPETPCDLAPRKLGEIQRDGYRVERLIFQTRPGVWMTANAYVPEKAKTEKVPAILHVHGHWAGAKQDRVVQSRCIGSVKHGFFVLVVDAYGAGERGIGKNLGEYHGEMTGATLFPVGLPLSGLQVYENMRAIDYLQTRPEVDAKKIGLTGASGGGNQTMYAGAFDERFSCIVPTCSVGTYQSYLGQACCMCEVVPGALRFTEEGDVLSLAAARGVMITSATKDAFQFSVGEAQKSFARVESIAKLLGKPDGVKHTIIDSGHDYNQAMREAMYGWMTRHLKGTGDGSPIADPEIKTEEPESLRCFPGDSRPDDYMTIPRFAAAEAHKLLDGRKAPESADAWNAVRAQMRVSLEASLGGTPKAVALNVKSQEAADGKSRRISFDSEAGLTLDLRLDATKQPKQIAVLVDVDQGSEKAFAGDHAKQLRNKGWTVAAPELRATGRFALPSDKIGHAPDHNTAEWSLWIGRPLLGQWVVDVRRTLDVLAEQQGGSLPSEVVVIGIGSSGVIALCAAALDERITHATAINSLSSYVTSEPYRNHRLGLMVPGVLRDVGDISHITALIAPRKVTVTGGLRGNGQEILGDDLGREFTFTRNIFKLLNVSPKFRIVGNGVFFDEVSTARF
ncbi:MAG: acetylxylan esterase [Planctomycetia bacterium]|nr:acetylxylan esterase [Planctomycetia bacterium]